MFALAIFDFSALDQGEFGPSHEFSLNIESGAASDRVTNIQPENLMGDAGSESLLLGSTPISPGFPDTSTREDERRQKQFFKELFNCKQTSKY
jgi:hypothetical protein